MTISIKTTSENQHVMDFGCSSDIGKITFDFVRRICLNKNYVKLTFEQTHF